MRYIVDERKKFPAEFVKEVRLMCMIDRLHNNGTLIIRSIYDLRSTTGTYNLLDENFRNTAAKISLYIRISCLGKCLVTEITRIESGMYGAFCARREPDKEQYLARQLTSDELQSGHWDVRDLPRIPRGRLVCRCEELRKKDLAVDLAGNWFHCFIQRCYFQVSSTRHGKSVIWLNSRE